MFGRLITSLGYRRTWSLFEFGCIPFAVLLAGVLIPGSLWLVEGKSPQAIVVAVSASALMAWASVGVMAHRRNWDGWELNSIL